MDSPSSGHEEGAWVCMCLQGEALWFEPGPRCPTLATAPEAPRGHPTADILASEVMQCFYLCSMAFQEFLNRFSLKALSSKWLSVGITKCI
jgi:hypothetical protein